eukprot:gene22562-29688_t
MGASEVVDLSGADPAWPAGGMQQVAQHKGGPGAQGMRPLTEAERVHMIRLGQQKQQQQPQARQHEGEHEGMIRVEKEAQAKSNYDQMIRYDVHYHHQQQKLQQRQEQSLVEKEKMRQAFMQTQTSKQALNLHAVPHTPQSVIPVLPNMFMQMPAYNRVGTSGKPPPTDHSTQQQGIKRKREGVYDFSTPGEEGLGGLWSFPGEEGLGGLWPT